MCYNYLNSFNSKLSDSSFATYSNQKVSQVGHLLSLHCKSVNPSYMACTANKVLIIFIVANISVLWRFFCSLAGCNSITTSSTTNPLVIWCGWGDFSLYEMNYGFNINLSITRKIKPRVLIHTVISALVWSVVEACSYQMCGNPLRVCDIWSPAEKTLAPERNRGEENDTPWLRWPAKAS